MSKPPPLTGPAALQAALQALPALDELSATLQGQIKEGSQQQRAKAIEQLNIVSGLQRSGLAPGQLFIHKVPVVPSQFRPYAFAGTTFRPGDVNELYAELDDMAQAHQHLKEELGEQAAQEESGPHLYRALKALYGQSEPIQEKTRTRRVSGFLQKITGTNPKQSFFQQQLLGRAQDFVGRAVISVNPELSLDEVGVPEEILWKAFAPHIQRRLVQQGQEPMQAIKLIQDRDAAASRALDEELTRRPVVYSRAPAWHRFSILGGYAKRLSGGGQARRQSAEVSVGPHSPVSEAEQVAGPEGIAHAEEHPVAVGSTELPGAGRRQDKRAASGRKPGISGGSIQERGEKGEKGSKVAEKSQKSASKSASTSSHQLFHQNYDSIQINPLVTTGYNADFDGDCQYSLVYIKLQMKTSLPFLLMPRNSVVVVDPDEGIVCCNLKDFPHGELVTEKMGVGGLIRLYAVAPGTEVLAQFPDGHTAWAPVQFWSEHVNRLVEVVTLQSGRQIVTDHHPRAVYGVCPSSNRLQRATPTDALTHHFLVPRLIQAPSAVASPIIHWHGRKLTSAYAYDLGVKAATKRSVPLWISQAGENVLQAFLAGFMDQGGTLSFVRPKAKATGQLQAGVWSSSLSMLQELQFIGRRLGIRSRLTYAPTGAGTTSWHLNWSATDFIRAEIVIYLQHPGKRAAVANAPVPQADSAAAIAQDLVPIPEKLARFARSCIPHPRLLHLLDVPEEDHQWHVLLSRAIDRGYLTRDASLKLRVRLPERLAQHPDFTAWWTRVQDFTITWDPVVQVERTGQRETGYDLTVPGAETFANADGVILSNTMSIHVPASPDAVQEVKDKLLASKLLFSIKDPEVVVPVPKHETTAGLYQAHAQPHKKVHTFATEQAARQAVLAGHVPLADEIQIGVSA